MSETFPDVHDVMRTLAGTLPAFLSEADFQHSLAWKLRERLPQANVFLEYPYGNSRPRKYLDIFVRLHEKVYAIELKYKTRRTDISIDDVDFVLLNQSAQDQARYDFIKDIVRLKEFYRNGVECARMAIFLTNDALYWNGPKSDRTVGQAFRLSNGHTLQGPLKWGAQASNGTIKGREGELRVDLATPFAWTPFGDQSSQKANGLFKYLLVKV